MGCAATVSTLKSANSSVSRQYTPHIPLNLTLFLAENLTNEVSRIMDLATALTLCLDTTYAG